MLDTKDLVSNLCSRPDVWCRTTVRNQIFRLEHAHICYEHVRNETFGVEPLVDTKYLVSNTSSKPKIWSRTVLRNQTFGLEYKFETKDLVSNICSKPQIWVSNMRSGTNIAGLEQAAHVRVSGVRKLLLGSNAARYEAVVTHFTAED